MARPQQPELHRSGHTPLDPGRPPDTGGEDVPRRGRRRAHGPVPEANQPGHHPRAEQDKPAGPPPVPGTAAATATDTATGPRRYAFEVDPWMAPFSLVFGVMPRTAWVEVGDAELTVRFGPWRLSTPLDNVAGAEITGPYRWAKVAGPPRLSFKDRGATLATSTRQGVCIRFTEPVGGLIPGLRHPAVTVTVAEPHGLVEALAERC